MERLNYKALFDAGEIKTMSDLIVLFRQEVISFYRSKVSWPEYKPEPEDLEILGIFQKVHLEEVMDFGTFCLVWKEMESLRRPAE